MLKRAQMSGNSPWASVTPPSVQKWSPFSGFGSMQMDNLHVLVLTSATILTSEVARNRFPFRVKKIFVGFVYTLKQKWFAFSFDFFSTLHIFCLSRNKYSFVPFGTLQAPSETLRLSVPLWMLVSKCLV